MGIWGRGQGRLRQTVRRLPLAAQLGLLTLGIVLSVWWVMESSQGAVLRRIFTQQLESQLEVRSRIDRQRFDEHVQSLPRAARILTGSGAFRDYIRDLKSDGPAPPILHHNSPPPWLADRAVLRMLFNAKFALLLDDRTRLREIYHHIPELDGKGIPAELLAPGRLLRKLSHSQAYLTELSGSPYVIAAQPVEDEQGAVCATLILASPLDDRFLAAAAGLFDRGSVMALVDQDSGVLLATSDAAVLPAGASLEQARRDHLMIGKSFFDYGASDLALVFASFLPRERATSITETVLGAVQRQRMALVAVLLVGFLSMVALIALRLRRLTSEVIEFSTGTLGAQVHELQSGDEVAVLEGEFDRLGQAILAYQDHLRRQTEERIELSRQAMEGEQRAREVEWLQSLTENLGVGILIERAGGWHTFNPLMERFAAECGGLARFAHAEGDESRELELSDCNGEQRVFGLERQQIIGHCALLVRDLTEERLVRRQLDVFSSFPERNPYPVLRVGLDGVLQYANEPAEDLLQAEGLEPGAPLPTIWQRRIEGAIGRQKVADFVIQSAGRHYAFTPVLAEKSAFFYIYSRDITEEKRAEQELLAAAKISEQVLDSVMVTDPDGVILQVNPAFTHVTGYKPEEVIGRTPAVLRSAHHDKGFFERFWQTLKSDFQWRGEIWNRRKNGDIFPSHMSINAIRDAAGAVVKYVSVMIDISENKSRELQLSRLAYRDPLTELPNRLLLQDRLQQAIVEAQREGGGLAVLFLDLDGFKAVNDGRGHDVGDLLLQQVAARLTESVRASDTVSRLGGDEFVVVMRHLEGDAAGVFAAAGKILQRLGAPYRLKGDETRISASIGVALFPEHALDPEGLIKRADDAMYRGKLAGKNRVCVAGDQESGASDGPPDQSGRASRP